MNPLEVGCFLLAIPQGIVAIYHLVSLSKGARMPARGWRAFFAAMLVIGVAFAVGLGVWVHDHPPKPNVVTVTKTITVTQPCPPSKSGAATTKETQSPAITGSNNAVNYGQHLPPQKPR